MTLKIEFAGAPSAARTRSWRPVLVVWGEAGRCFAVAEAAPDGVSANARDPGCIGIGDRALPHCPIRPGTPTTVTKATALLGADYRSIDSIRCSYRLISDMKFRVC